MERDNPRAVVTKWVDDVLNKGDLDAADVLLSDDVVFHHAGVPEPLRSIDTVKHALADLRSAFPDLHSPMLNVTAEDDRVSVRFRWRGTHRGEFQGCPPTQRPITIQGSGLYRVDGARIAEAWADFDIVELLRQIGGRLPAGGARS